MFDMENVISVVGAAIVASVIGAFMMFECPEPIRVPYAVTSAVMCNLKNKRNE